MTTTISLGVVLGRGLRCAWNTKCGSHPVKMLNSLPYCAAHGAAGLRAIANIRQ